MNYAIKELERKTNVLFKNRHDVGWGYIQNKEFKKYKKCQKHRRDELTSFIQVIHFLRKTVNAN